MECKDKSVHTMGSFALLNMLKQYTVIILLVEFSSQVLTSKTARAKGFLEVKNVRTIQLMHNIIIKTFIDIECSSGCSKAV